MLTLRSVQIVLIALSVGLVVACGGNSDDDVPLVFAAASLSDVLVESADLYKQETGNQVEFSFGGSLTLANQIASLGAPADGMILAGYDVIDIVERTRELPKENPNYPIKNRLVIVEAIGEGSFASLADLPVRTDGKLIAMGDPSLAPAGVFARQALESAAVWSSVEGNIVQTVDVRAALAAVESGNAKFGIVYMTDAVSSDSVSIVYEIIEGHDPIDYLPVPFEDVEDGRAAQEFFEFLRRDGTSRSIFEEAGFLVTAPTPRQ